MSLTARLWGAHPGMAVALTPNKKIHPVDAKARSKFHRWRETTRAKTISINNMLVDKDRASEKPMVN
jgi:hypothetical protein